MPRGGVSVNMPFCTTCTRQGGSWQRCNWGMHRPTPPGPLHDFQLAQAQCTRVWSAQIHTKECPEQQQQNNLERLHFNKRGASTPLWGVCSTMHLCTAPCGSGCFSTPSRAPPALTVFCARKPWYVLSASTLSKLRWALRSGPS